MGDSKVEDKSVTLFREYLRIKSVHPNPDYVGAVNWLTKLANKYKCDAVTTVELKPGKPIVIFTWKGTDSLLPSILLNSHTDVVPAVTEKWKCDPFDAYKDEQGNIFARGTQDMKCVGIQYLEAIGRLKANKDVKFLRDIHASYVPDEEIGGGEGMALFVESELFNKLNVGVVLDEGLASPDDTFTVFWGERMPWWVKIRAVGPTGHGSRFIENTAMEKMIKVVNKLLNFRKDQFDELQRGMAQCGMKLGDVTTLNMTYFKGGVTTDGKNYSINVIPTEAEAGFDIRIPPTVDLNEFKKQLDEWTAEEGVSYEFTNLARFVHHTSSTDGEWFKIFRNVVENQLQHKIDLQVFPAATDSRFIRSKGVPAFGFSPINHTPILLHDHNEFLNEKTFLRGIEVYYHLIPALANAPVSQ